MLHYVAQMPRSKTNSALLSRREREIMNAVFALANRASADEIRARLTNPPRRFSRPRYVRKARKEGLPEAPVRRPTVYLFRHNLSGLSRKRTALQQYLQTFFGGSLRQMMTALVAEASWTDDDLDALKDEIDRVRKERKNQS